MGASRALSGKLFFSAALVRSRGLGPGCKLLQYAENKGERGSRLGPSITVCITSPQMLPDVRHSHERGERGFALRKQLH
jgi:hypothetical protein